MTFNAVRYILRETVSSVRHNPWLSIASVLTVMVSLVILGFSIFFLANASNIARTFEDELEIVAFLRETTTSVEIQGLKTRVENMAGVASVTIVTKEQVLEEVGKTMGGSQSNILADLGGNNPFTDELTIKAKNAQDVVGLAETINNLPEVRKVRYGEGFVEKLLTFTQWLRWIGLGVVAAFGAAAVVLISINVKMNVFSRRREIQIMRLVGASNSFIRWPFLVEGLALGLVGGLLAAILVGMGYSWLSTYVQLTLTFLPVVQNSALFGRVFAVLLFTGMVMGALGSGFSLQKFLRS